METQETKSFIKGKVLEYLNNVQMFYAKVQKDQVEMQHLLTEVKLSKTEDGEEGFENNKVKLIRIQELHYNTYLLDQGVKQSQGLLYEYDMMAKLHGVEIKMDSETEDFFKSAVASNPHLFRTQQGEVILNKSDETDAAMSALEKKIRSEDNLKRMYTDL